MITMRLGPEAHHSQGRRRKAEDDQGDPQDHDRGREEEGEVDGRRRLPRDEEGGPRRARPLRVGTLCCRRRALTPPGGRWQTELATPGACPGFDSSLPAGKERYVAAIRRVALLAPATGLAPGPRARHPSPGVAGPLLQPERSRGRGQLLLPPRPQ